jgi:hypothetical protein
MCSCRFSPTPGRSTMTGILTDSSTSFFPIPESSRIWGDLSALRDYERLIRRLKAGHAYPADKMTSRPTLTE